MNELEEAAMARISQISRNAAEGAAYAAFEQVSRIVMQMLEVQKAIHRADKLHRAMMTSLTGNKD